MKTRIRLTRHDEEVVNAGKHDVIPPSYCCEADRRYLSDLNMVRLNSVILGVVFTYKEVEEPSASRTHACDRHSSAERADLTCVKKGETQESSREEQTEQEDECSSDSYCSLVVGLA